MNQKYKFAIVDEDSLKAVRVFTNEDAAWSALNFWNRNSFKYFVTPIDGVK